MADQGPHPAGPDGLDHGLPHLSRDFAAQVDHRPSFELPEREGAGNISRVLPVLKGTATAGGRNELKT